MSTFKSTLTTRTMEIPPGTLHILIHDPEEETAGILLDSSDAPAIALAILKAAGHASQVFDATAVQCAVGNLERHMDDDAAGSAARDKRRDELVQELATFHTSMYGNLGGITQRAIDRIIDLEQECDGK